MSRLTLVALRSAPAQASYLVAFKSKRGGGAVICLLLLVALTQGRCSLSQAVLAAFALSLVLVPCVYTNAKFKVSSARPSKRRRSLDSAPTRQELIASTMSSCIAAPLLPPPAPHKRGLLTVRNACCRLCDLVFACGRAGRRVGARRNWLATK